MSHITLIRHGQANTGATDEASYDKLSPLGHTQAAWLGTHLREARDFHTRLYSGTLRRHVETAASMETGLDPVRDARLNELEYLTLAQLMHEQHGIEVPTTQEGFTVHLPQVFQYWKDGRLADTPETFDAFETRVAAALADIAQGQGPALVVTSGGVIAMAMRQALGLDINGMARIALAIMNSSMHRLFPIGGTWSPVLFNAVPHLDPPDRHEARTHV
ncbi:MAG: histidine phosphatase family protein [Marinibacterium sp.]|nr:histidine phosphatase family protein [Marinibacterium sp.]